MIPSHYNHEMNRAKKHQVQSHHCPHPLPPPWMMLLPHPVPNDGTLPYAHAHHISSKGIGVDLKHWVCAVQCYSQLGADVVDHQRHARGRCQIGNGGGTCCTGAAAQPAACAGVAKISGEQWCWALPPMPLPPGALCNVCQHHTRLDRLAEVRSLNELALTFRRPSAPKLRAPNGKGLYTGRLYTGGVDADPYMHTHGSELPNVNPHRPCATAGRVSCEPVTRSCVSHVQSLKASRPKWHSPSMPHRKFHRQRLVEAGRNCSDMDLAFTAIIACDDTCCKDQQALYGTAERVSRSTMWQYKCLIPPIPPASLPAHILRAR